MRPFLQTFLLCLFVVLFVSVHGRNECTPGSYLTPSGRKCMLCPPGTFQPDSGATGCIPCPKGSVTSKKGATSCISCEDSEASNSDRTSCICARGYAFNYKTDKCKICPPGTEYSGTGETSFCEGCSPGYYQPYKGDRQCLECPAGSMSGFKAKKCTVCPKGDVLIKEKCGKCPAGKYYDMYATSCEKCYPGTYRPSESTARDCLPCPQGSYSGFGYSACVRCRNKTALMKNGKCGSCKAGQYYDSYDRKCYKCETDTFTPNRHVYPSCFNCGFSSFSFAGSKKCTRCKYGSSLLHSGTCGKCFPGTYLATNKGRKCTKCGANEYSFGGIMEYCPSCPQDMYALPGSSVCTTCPEGQALIVQKGKCGVCPPGKEYSRYDGTCERCYSGEYKPEPGIESCSYCPEGFKSTKDRTACVESRT